MLSGQDILSIHELGRLKFTSPSALGWKFKGRCSFEKGFLVAKIILLHSFAFYNKRAFGCQIVINSTEKFKKMNILRFFTNFSFMYFSSSPKF